MAALFLIPQVCLPLICVRVCIGPVPMILSRLAVGLKGMKYKQSLTSIYEDFACCEILRSFVVSSDSSFVAGSSFGICGYPDVRRAAF